MNRFVTTLLVSLSLIYGHNCSEFCDVQAFDNVFNLGHFVHMTRCGEVWTFDPRMNSGEGGFIRDYSVYTYARKFLMNHILNEYMSFDPKYFRFGVFFFSELECGHINLNKDNECQKSVDAFNYFGVIFGNTTAFPFKFKNNIDEYPVNPFGIKWNERIESINPKTLWPDLPKLAQNMKMYYFTPDRGYQHSALFSPQEKVLYMALRGDHPNQFCVTYLNMEEILFNVKKNRIGSKDFQWQWSSPLCFSGRLVGMFHNEVENRSYIVGRMLDSRVFEDQIYTLKAPLNSQPEVQILYKEQTKGGKDWAPNTPINLGNYFGCPYDRYERPKRSLQPSLHTKQSQQSEEENKRMESWNFKELRDDWIQLSLMSFIALFLLFVLYKYQKY